MAQIELFQCLKICCARQNEMVDKLNWSFLEKNLHMRNPFIVCLSGFQYFLKLYVRYFVRE